ncbi:AN1-type zinc finger protein 2A [Phascolarctos cinereus]|uniref:AN1-type zinc finger protein 2A n=1 Tax=Phascolarctos cinereus TaxID=38626 RepID=A0A6P5JTL7_PHACI|nr:AN1-type zinc finger protein 2A [Phascolarctos cinereus]XP_020834335.1 AN1-type zinc finger protein 2A [Phascolarctos cinereus]
MEFPDLGEHCSEKTCKQLDFLPLNCDACDKVFCKDHAQYERHKCGAAYKKDMQVPVCPLCHVPVPVGRGEIADVVVGQHMDKDCKYNPAQEKKIFIHRCSKEGCKKKELFKLLCDQCNDNFCIKHRHPLDHNCKHSGHSISKAGCAAIMRAAESSGASNKLSSSWLAQRLRGKQKS